MASTISRIVVVLLAVLHGLAETSVAAESGTEKHDAPRVLIFSHTTGYRHDSIEPGIEALRALGEAAGYVVEASEDPAVFDRGAPAIDAIILLSATTHPRKPWSEWFRVKRRRALLDFVESGGGLVGIHAATDSHYFWPGYARLLGARFRWHPRGTPAARLRVVDSNHPATRELPAEFERVDEWYWFRSLNPDVKILVTLDPASIGEDPGDAIPISWSHSVAEGRIFYTAMGHTAESFSDPLFLAHVEGGLRWALGDN